MFLTVKRMTKELFVEKTRMFLTILAIAWGTFTIASMLSIGEGLRVTFGQSVAGLENQLQVTSGKTSKSYRGLSLNQPITFTASDYDAIKASLKENIQMMTPIYSTPWSKLQYGNQTSYANILAVNSTYANMSKMNIDPSGRFISPLDIKNNRKVIVLGSDIKFKSLENPVGRKVYINGQPFLVVGQLAPKAQMGGRRQNDAIRAFIPYSTYKLLMNPQKIDSFIIAVKNTPDETLIENKIQTIVALIHHADPTDTNIVTVRNFSKRQAKVNDFFFGMQIFLGIVGALTLMVAGVGIANVMYASVSRATHEIGVRMAIGARTHQILAHYIGEALLATLIGGAAGLIMTLFLVLGINHMPLTLPEWLAKIISRPEAILSWNVIISVILVLGITGLLAGLFPALKASRVDPSEALRYE